MPSTLFYFPVPDCEEVTNRMKFLRAQLRGLLDRSHDRTNFDDNVSEVKFNATGNRQEVLFEVRPRTHDGGAFGQQVSRTEVVGVDKAEKFSNQIVKQIREQFEDVTICPDLPMAT